MGSDVGFINSDFSLRDVEGAFRAVGTTIGAVHVAKFRVLTRLRQELGELLD